VKKRSKWQKQGMYYLVGIAIGMILCAGFKDIYFEFIFGVLFIVVAIALRINIESEKIRK